MALHPGESERRARLANAFRRHVPPLPSRRPVEPARLEVFAVGTTSVQLAWGALGPGPCTATVDGVEHAFEADGGPGAVTIDGLDAGRSVAIRLHGPRLDVSLTARTLDAPGPLVHRVASLNDVHLGSTSTGYLHTMVEKPAPLVAHPFRCGRAALRAAVDAGATDLLVKGDLVDRSDDDHWGMAATLLGDFPGFPDSVHVVRGNHEHRRRPTIDPVAGAAAVGIDLVHPVGHVDRPGVRMILVDTGRYGRDTGRLDHVVADVADLAAGAGDDRSVLVALHHQPTRWPFPTYLPPGVPGPESRRFLDTLHRAAPGALVVAGHTHRHRRWRHRSVTVAEVGSTKDYPGSWARYDVHEGGIVQSVRRIEEPSCIRWTEYTRRAAFGVWQHWSPGDLDDRCFVVTRGR